MIGARIVIALPAEARPLIAHWGLRRDGRATAFPVYDGEGLALVVSGVGRTAAASATRWLATARPSAPVWLNLGIAGHPALEPGAVRIAQRIEDASTRQCWVPPPVPAAPCAGDDLRTEERPKEQLRHCCLHDMEAAAFYPAAVRFTTAERVQCLKIVSDNGGEQARTLSAGAVTAFVAAHLKTIDALLDAMRALAPQGSGDESRRDPARAQGPAKKRAPMTESEPGN